MDHFRTQYERLYESDDYFWGTEPADFLQKLIEAKPPRHGMKVLDIGCGEGKDAVYMAQRGYWVTAFDLTESGIRKTLRLASERGVKVNAYTADINDFTTDERFDIVYSSGTIQYLAEENIPGFFEKVGRITNPHGLNFFNVFVEKPFLELPPDWDREEKMWKTGDLFSYYADWKIRMIDEVIFEDNSGGIPHFHCMDSILAEKVTGGRW